MQKRTRNTFASHKTHRISKLALRETPKTIGAYRVWTLFQRKRLDNLLYAVSKELFIHLSLVVYSMNQESLRCHVVRAYVPPTLTTENSINFEKVYMDNVSDSMLQITFEVVSDN
ncbi:unnamed protein product [Cylicocyclus nassatus]|uniref:Uncharacterized protein n=1 Tax=Cylicocyclus nassatus TaxID=53992 RepID=A0AA36GR28_CYLNA|nr:unnamed protein product [Cylicocyclus nassatus]